MSFGYLYKCEGRLARGSGRCRTKNRRSIPVENNWYVFTGSRLRTIRKRQESRVPVDIKLSTKDEYSYSKIERYVYLWTLSCVVGHLYVHIYIKNKYTTMSIICWKSVMHGISRIECLIKYIHTRFSRFWIGNIPWCCPDLCVHYVHHDVCGYSPWARLGGERRRQVNPYVRTDPERQAASRTETTDTTPTSVVDPIY